MNKNSDFNCHKVLNPKVSNWRIFCIFILIPIFQTALAENYIECNFINVNGDDKFTMRIVQDEDEVFYALPSEQAKESSVPKQKLLAHWPDKDYLETMELMSALGLPLGPKVTFLELLGSGGISVTSVDITTKKGWLSRHTVILSQYEGDCVTNIF